MTELRMSAVHHPADEREWLALRANYITSTEVAGLFNLPGAYATAYQLWHRKKKGYVVNVEATEPMKWGTRLQDAIAAGVAEDQGWTIRQMDEFIADEDLRLGASFDYRVLTPEDAILEIKNVDAFAFRDGWIVDGDYIEAPPRVEIQVQTQMAVSGLSTCYIAALVGGNKPILIKRERHEGMIARIREKVAEFWAAEDEPPPDLGLDAKFISQLYGYAEPGKVLDARGNAELTAEVAEYLRYASMEREAAGKKEQSKARILMAIGEAEKVLLNSGIANSITAGLVGPAHVEFDRKGYRAFRVNTRRAKDNATR